MLFIEFKLEVFVSEAFNTDLLNKFMLFKMIELFNVPFKKLLISEVKLNGAVVVFIIKRGVDKVELEGDELLDVLVVVVEVLEFVIVELGVLLEAIVLFEVVVTAEVKDVVTVELEVVATVEVEVVVTVGLEVVLTVELEVVATVEVEVVITVELEVVVEVVVNVLLEVVVEVVFIELCDELLIVVEDV